MTRALWFPGAIARPYTFAADRPSIVGATTGPRGGIFHDNSGGRYATVDQHLAYTERMWPQYVASPSTVKAPTLAHFQGDHRTGELFQHLPLDRRGIHAINHNSLYWGIETSDEGELTGATIPWPDALCQTFVDFLVWAAREWWVPAKLTADHLDTGWGWHCLHYEWHNGNRVDVGQVRRVQVSEIIAAAAKILATPVEPPPPPPPPAAAYPLEHKVTAAEAKAGWWEIYRSTHTSNPTVATVQPLIDANPGVRLSEGTYVNIPGELP